MLRRFSLLLVVILLIPSISVAADAIYSQEDIPRISVDELKALLDDKEDVHILDVRSHSSYDKSNLRIKGDRRILFEEIESWASSVPKDARIVTYCT